MPSAGAQQNLTHADEGLPAAELARVMKAFYMADKSRGRSEGGAGFVLVLCQKIASLHGWQFVLECEEGRETTASVLWQAAKFP